MVGVSSVPSTTSAVGLGGCQAANSMSGSAVSVREIDPFKIKSVGVNNVRFSGAVTGRVTLREKYQATVRKKCACSSRPHQYRRGSERQVEGER